MGGSTCSAEPSNTAKEPRPEETAKSERNTYGQILKSSALVGGSSVANIAIGVIRSKVMAVLLGPSGFGLFGLYASILNLAESIGGFGINSSGVRQIAEATGLDDTDQIARTITVLRRVALVLGVLAAAGLILLSRPISKVTFGDYRHTTALSILAAAVFFRLISAGQGALIQGLRRIAELAKMNIFGALLGTGLTLALVYVFRQRGVALSLVAVAVTSCLSSWWYSRRVHVKRVCMSAVQVRQQATDLLKLGFAFMASGFMVMGSAYAVRTSVFHHLGLEATGYYQAAWTLGGFYVSIILQAMGADFYPRLTCAAANNTECNRLVNEQTLISLLLAGPGVLLTLTLAPVVISVFYAAEFAAAVGVLRWICLGATLQVITFPIGYIILAKGAQGYFFWTELAWTVVHVSLAKLCLNRFGLMGAGMGFFGSYVFHAFVIYHIVRRLSGFRWSAINKKLGLIYVLTIGVVFSEVQFLPFPLAGLIGTIVAILSSFYSIRVLLAIISLDHIPAVFRRILGSRIAACLLGTASE
jgi:antigen flippase